MLHGEHREGARAFEHGIYLNKIGLGSWEVIQEGDYLTADLDISVTIHGMMWGEVEREMESTWVGHMAHGRKDQDQ